MKIVFLNPPFKTQYGKFSRASRSPAVTKSGTLYYPIWLSYAAGVSKMAGHEVLLMDSCAYSYDEEKTFDIIKKFNPSLIVIDTSTPSIYNDIEIGDKLKSLIENVIVVLVGTHVSALPEESLKLSKRIDAIAMQEYDYTIRELADKLEELNKNLKNDVTKDINTKWIESLKAINGLAYRESEKIIINKPRDFIKDLDDLPFISKVYKENLDIYKYFFSAAEYPMVMMMTGRGCPARCFFCVYPQTFHSHKYRLRSAQNVVDEFQYIVDNMPEVKEVGIEDDTFTADVKRVEEICKLLIERGINKKVKWWANARVNLPYETMKLMKKAGCRLVIPGIESGDQTILNNIKKGIKVEKSIEFVKNANRAGLLVHGCFMVGNMGETKESMMKTLELAKSMKLDTAQFFPLIPYPGTEAFKWAKENGYLKSLDYTKWLAEDGMHNCVIDLPELKAEELVEFCNYARKKFYLRPKYILYKLGQVFRSRQEFKRTVKSFLIFFPKLISKK